MLPDYSDSSPNSPTPIITNNDTSTFTSSAQIDTHSIILPDYSDNSCPNSHTHLITKKDTPAFNPSPQIDSNSFMLPDYPDTSSPNSPAPLITKKDPSTSGGQIDPNSFILPDYSDDSSPKSPTTLITKNNTQPFKQSAQIDTHSFTLPDYSDNSAPNSPLPSLTANYPSTFNPIAEIKSSPTSSSTSQDELEFPPEIEALPKIGQGAFGSVHKARIGGSVCAIKVVRRLDREDKDITAPIHNEAVILQELNHPHIIQAVDYFYNPENLYIVQEFASRGNLFKFIEGEKISEEKARSIILNIGSALDYIHSRGIIHRDVKLDNILITADYRFKLADFGLATKTEDGFASGDCGTPYIKAPEILKGVPYTQAVDWWALGIMLCQMVGGNHPFGQVDEPMQYQILHSDPTIPLSVSYMGSDLIMKLLNKDVGSRINSYSDLMSHDFFTCKFIV